MSISCDARLFFSYSVHCRYADGFCVCVYFHSDMSNIGINAIYGMVPPKQICMHQIAEDEWKRTMTFFIISVKRWMVIQPQKKTNSTKWWRTIEMEQLIAFEKQIHKLQKKNTYKVSESNGHWSWLNTILMSIVSVV